MVAVFGRYLNSVKTYDNRFLHTFLRNSEEKTYEDKFTGILKLYMSRYQIYHKNTAKKQFERFHFHKVFLCIALPCLIVYKNKHWLTVKALR